MKSTKIGVIIARFQVPDLHEGHIYLITEILKRHDRVLILLGVAPIKLSENDPLNFETRKLMLKSLLEVFQNTIDRVTILPIYDKKQSDELWSKGVDDIIKETFYLNDKGAILYGSRDSFIPHYKGVFETVEIETKYPNLKGTNLREEVVKEILPSSDFRRGVIYATFDKFPLVYSCVDVAIMDRKEILLGHKETDPEGEYRFIGGFVDPNDSSDFAAARRESYEETRAEVEPYAYICSQIVNDWRYAKEKNAKIMTRLILAEYISGGAEGSDDLESVKWFEFSDLIEENFVKEHRPLFQALKEYKSKNK
jgi:bifunctional NMN adenylyltransferase/nudix hydrolase